MVAWMTPRGRISCVIACFAFVLATIVAVGHATISGEEGLLPAGLFFFALAFVVP